MELIKRNGGKVYNARLSEHISLFCKEFNITLYNKGARMLDSIFLAHRIRISEILP